MTNFAYYLYSFGCTKVNVNQIRLASLKSQLFNSSGKIWFILSKTNYFHVDLLFKKYDNINYNGVENSSVLDVGNSYFCSFPSSIFNFTFKLF